MGKKKKTSEWQNRHWISSKITLNEVAGCPRVLPTCHLLPDLTHTISLSSPDFFSPLSFPSVPVSFSRNLSYNNLTRLDEGILSVLGDLHTLRLGHNSISHITEGAFRGLKALRVLWVKPPRLLLPRPQTSPDSPVITVLSLVKLRQRSDTWVQWTLTCLILVLCLWYLIFSD